MRKIITSTVAVILAAAAMAQTPQPEKQSIVVSRYGTDPATAEQPLYTGPQYPINKWRVGLDVAFSQRIAKTFPSLSAAGKDFVNRMRSGVAYGVDAHFFFPGGFGLGPKFSGHYYSHSEQGLKDKVSTYYAAPSFMWRGFDRRDRNAFYMAVSLGYLYFRETAVSGMVVTTAKGGFGSSLDVGYDIRLGDGKTFLGFKFSLVGGSVSLGKIAGENIIESLSAIEIGTGLRF